MVNKFIKIFGYSLLIVYVFIVFVAFVRLKKPEESFMGASPVIKEKISDIKVKEDKEVKIDKIDWSKQEIDRCSILFDRETVTQQEYEEYQSCLSDFSKEIKGYKIDLNYKEEVLKPSDLAIIHDQLKNDLEVDKKNKVIKFIGDENLKSYKEFKVK